MRDPGIGGALVSIPLRCKCGRVRGTADVSPDSGNRLICYCDDCQAFARYLGQEGALDAAGGTDIFQMAPARLHLTAGTSDLACLRLSPKGLLRWYAGCCKTPIANTVGPQLPVAGVIHTFMDHAEDGRPRDEVLGPVFAGVHGRFARGGLPPGAERTASLRTMGRVVRRMLRWWIGGKGRPSPFFDPRTRAPVVTPIVLTRAERDALRG